MYTCSICLDQLREPVTIPCGHSYCLGCIKDYWSKETTFYSCPQCRKIFTLRPALEKNTVLAEIIENTEAAASGEPGDDPAPHSAGPGVVVCDFCTTMKIEAVKTCLVCLVSFCEEHVQSHYQVAGLRRHKLVEPTGELQESICPRHDEVMRIYCLRDRVGICNLCAVDDHRGHETVTAEAERLERQKDLINHQRVTQARIQKVEEDVAVLQEEGDSINQSANIALRDIDKLFAEMIRPLESQKADIKEKIRTKEKVAVGRLQDLQRNREQEISVMRRSIDDLEALLQSHSDIHFLQEYPQNLILNKYTGLPPRDTDPMQYLNNVTVALAKMRDKLKVFVKDAAPPVSLAVAEVNAVLPSQQAEPKSRSDFLQYSCELSFDPKTKTKFLTLSEDEQKVMSQGNKKVKYVGSRAVRPRKNRDRGKQQPLDWAVEQCLSKESLTGRQYWEVGWTTRYVSIAMGYKDSSWKDQGADDKSWALIVCPTAVEFKHNDVITLLPGPHPSRVGVYLDYRAGTLRFYCSDTMTLLHQVHTIFTQPLFAGVTLDAQSGATAEFCYPRLV